MSGRDLPRMQNISATDAFAVLYTKDNTDTLVHVGTTHVVTNNQNPDWAPAFTVDYLFEVEQEMVVKVYQFEEGKPLTTLSAHPFIGQATFLLADVVRAGARKTIGLTSDGRPKGNIELHAESQVNTRDVFVATFKGRKLINKDGFFGKSDPFLVISRLNEDATHTIVWKSNKIDNNLSPVFPPAKIPMVKLCNGDIHRPLKIEIFDWDSGGKHDAMGYVETSVNDLLTRNEAEIKVKYISKKPKDAGYFMATNVLIEHHPTFTDFIKGGCEMSLIAAIDFTGSNGDPDMINSLHHIDATGNSLNDYQSAISSVGRILEHYDSDKKYPVFGFGAKVRTPDGSYSAAQHCFPVYGGGLEVEGVQGILQAYKDCVTNVLFSGPTLLAPLINKSCDIAAAANCTQENQKYTILLIITDGVINDMDATKAAIVRASSQPLSIIIIGVGNADFSGMKELDGDKVALRSGMSEAERDIIQFVQHTNQPFMQLAQQVLQEVPDQVLQFMEKRHITPLKN